VLLLLATTPSACITVGPDYELVEPFVPDSWSATDAPTQEALFVAEADQWWQEFDDPLLVSLVERAAAGSLDVRAAGARIAQARASLGINQADLWPTVDASASATRSVSSPEVSSGQEVDFLRASLDAGWELDLFGGTRRSIEAAVADYEGRIADRDAVMVSISAEVAQRYVDVRELQDRIRIASDNLLAQQETYELVQFRAEAGLSTGLDVQLARSNLESTRARIPELENLLARTRHSLALLLGLAPGALDAELASTVPIPTPVADLAVGVPADALRSRPDIRSAERAVATQSALVGVSTAQLYPRFRLSGSIGLEALSLDGLFGGDATAWSAGPSIGVPIFNRGRLRRGVDLQYVVLDQAEIEYERTVLNALAEVEDALVAVRTNRERRDAYGEAAAAAGQAVTLSLELYSTGVRDFQSVLEAQRSLYSFQDLAAQSEADATTSLVRLYKALGGGWQLDDTGAT
jgi:NodT family efflux transporter outer membrane factor (OMF) lipoprotein